MSKRPTDTRRTDARALRKRRPAAVEAWFYEHVDALYTFVFYRVGKEHDLATDVVQDTFAAALDKIDDYDPERGAMRTWLTYVARNRIRTALQQSGHREMQIAFWDEIDRKLLAAYRGLSTSPLPEEVLQRRETTELVQAALSNIPDHYQRALRQHYYDQQTLEEIARGEDMTAGAVKSLLHRARAAFKAAVTTIVDTLAEQQPSPEANQ